MQVDPRIEKVHILIAHHQENVRSALTFLLSQEPNFHVVGEACDLEELMNSLSDSHVDTILLDCDLVGKPITDQIAEFQEQTGNLKVVVLCSSTETKQTLPSTGDYTLVDITEHPRNLISTLRVLELERNYE